VTPVFVTLGSLIVFLGLYFALPHLFSKWRRKVLRKKAQGKLALTFDDGPCPRMTFRILDLLDEYDAKATFFILGRRLEGKEKILDEVVKRGHEVGGHGFGHIHYWKVMPWKTTADIHHCKQMLQPWTKEIPTTLPFRPPYGKLNIWSLWFLIRKKIPIVWWTVDSGDTWTPRPNPARVGNLLLQEGGGVVLLHDLDRKDPKDENWTLECLRQTLERIRNERPGWKIGTISELGLP
jgi:peptidoglycan/xylan/chitin deacetylase (PgdA/CDA1 family)